MKVIGLWIDVKSGINVTARDEEMPDVFLLYQFPRENLPDYLAAWLEVFEIVQGMIVRGVEAVDGKA